MTLEQYITQQKEVLKTFEQHWKQMQKLAPDHYPTELDAGEWDEQLQIFDPANVLNIPE